MTLAALLALATILLAHYARGYARSLGRAWDARTARARERRRVLRDAAIIELERQVLAEESPESLSLLSGYDAMPQQDSGRVFRIRIKDGKRFHVYADHAVYVGRVDDV